MKQHKKVFDITLDNRRIIREFVDYKSNKSLIDRPRNLESPLRKLADYLGEKSLSKATSEDIEYFLNPKNNIVSIKSRNYILNQLKLFYRWIDDVDRHTMPDRLRRIENISNKQLRRFKDHKQKIKHLITPKDYKKIIKYSNDAFGQNKALWELMALSGARPEEVSKLQINNIEIQKNTSNVVISIDEGKSKTLPRDIPLPAPAPNLIRWLGNHPYRENKNSLLWVSEKTGKPITISKTDPSEFIRRRLNVIKKIDKTINQTISPKSFRKNKATQLFNDKNMDIGDIAKIMGWTIQTADFRRKEYQLTDYEDLKHKIFTFKSAPKDNDSILLENKQLKQENNEIIKKITNMEDDLKSLKRMITNLGFKEIDGIMHEFVEDGIYAPKIYHLNNDTKKQYVLKDGKLIEF